MNAVGVCLHALLMLWAAAWTWFALGSVVTDAARLTWPDLALALVLIGVMTLALWRKRLGGVALLVLACEAAWCYRADGTRPLFTLPAALLGLGFVLLGFAEKRWPGRDAPPTAES